jgi:hypothetical protein
MGNAKKYVCVANFGVKDSFDNKYKSSLPKIMKAAAEKAVNGSSKLTTKPPADKTEEGFYMDGSLSSLTKTGAGTSIALKGKIMAALATWPKKSMFAFPSAEAKIDGAAEKTLDRDVEDLVKGIVDGVMETAIKELEKRA